MSSAISEMVQNHKKMVAGSSAFAALGLITAFISEGLHRKHERRLLTAFTITVTGILLGILIPKIFKEEWGHVQKVDWAAFLGLIALLLALATSVIAQTYEDEIPKGWIRGPIIASSIVSFLACAAIAGAGLYTFRFRNTSVFANPGRD